MTRRIAVRLVLLIAVLLVVSFLTFGLLSLLPGDPAVAVVGAENATPESLAAARAELGLDKPFLERYVDWLGGVVQGDLGRSLRTNQTVTEALGERLPVTVQIGVLALLLALLVAVPIAVLSAYRADSKLDKTISSASFGLLSVPVFILGSWLGYLAAVRFGWLPRSGWVRLTEDPVLNLKHALLPAVSLAVAEAAVYTRILRADMINTLQEDFLTLARSKGLPTRHLLFRHALRPSSLSLMTVVGLNCAALLGGSVIVEQIFALPGIGTMLLQAITTRDYVVVQGLVLVLAAGFVIVNFLVDMLYVLLDPRIR